MVRLVVNFNFVVRRNFSSFNSLMVRLVELQLNKLISGLQSFNSLMVRLVAHLHTLNQLTVDCFNSLMVRLVVSFGCIILS